MKLLHHRDALLAINLTERAFQTGRRINRDTNKETERRSVRQSHLDNAIKTSQVSICLPVWDFGSANVMLQIKRRLVLKALLQLMMHVDIKHS